MRSRITNIVLSCVLLAIFAVPVSAQVASVLISAGEVLPGSQPPETVSFILNTDTNAVGGYAFSLASDTFNGSLVYSIWGNPVAGPGTVLRRGGIIDSVEVETFDPFFGLSDGGSICYSSAFGGPDGVFLDDMVLLLEDNPIAPFANEFSTSNFRPNITADGTPYWVGAFSDTPGGDDVNDALFMGVNADIVVSGGSSINGVAEPLLTDIDSDVRISDAGSNYIMAGRLEGPVDVNAVLIINGSAVSAGGVLVREGNIIPAAIGGDENEYQNFDFLGINENQDFLLTGDSDGDFSSDEFVMLNGVIVLREGDMLGDRVISGSIEAAFLTEDGDWGVVWDVDTPAGDNLEVLIFNGQIVLSEGDLIDFNGDGVINAADNQAVLSSFTGTNPLTISEPDGSGMVRAYFVGEVDSSQLNSLECGFEISLSDSLLKGDVNGDGAVDLLDVGPFVEALTSGVFVAAADVDCNGVVNLLDVNPFVSLLTGG